MDTYEVIINRRSIRRFKQAELPEGLIERCINAARLAPCKANLQPLEFITVEGNTKEFFRTTKWAGYLDSFAPADDEKPVAYIVIISDSDIATDCRIDAGIAAQNIVLTALNDGVASCMLGSLDKDRIKKILSIPENYSIELAIALGYPAMDAVEEEFAGDVKYRIDGNGVLHVPKRKLDDVMHKESFQERKEKG